MRKNTQRTGARKSEAIRVPSIANIFVNASGLKSFPSCPVRANIGTKERTIIIIANRSGQATSLVDSMIIWLLCFIPSFVFQKSLSLL